MKQRQYVLDLDTGAATEMARPDPVEAVLYVACGVCIIGFCTSVLLDVVTRQIGYPWLWLQQLTSGCFVYGIFLGMAPASR